MRFRLKIFLVIFAVGLLPALILLSISAYLLNSTLNRVGAAGLESSVEAAGSMVAESEFMIGDILFGFLMEDIPWGRRDELNAWRQEKNLDLVVRESHDTFSWATSDSLKIDSNSFGDILSRPGLRHLELDDQSVLLMVVGDSVSARGCGMLMPAGYAARGRQLSSAISAAASLTMYKDFSVQLLTAVTGATLLFIIIAGFVVSRTISGQLVKPLEKLTEGARHLGRGEFDYRVDLPGGDEFAGLAGSFNKMASEIAENQKKLIEAERLAAWREVARRIAHEIRNPITPITVELYRLQKTLLSGGDIESEKMSNSLEAINSQIEILKELAEHFSAFAKEPELHKRKCSIEDIIEQTAKFYDNPDNVSIVRNISPDLPQIEVDDRMLGRAFGNIIKNSIEASSESARIEINVTKESEGIKVVFKDSGPGFPPEKLNDIETPYITTKKSGTGLGLAIAGKIVKEHGGSMKLYNHGGAVVEVSLPAT